MRGHHANLLLMFFAAAAVATAAIGCGDKGTPTSPSTSSAAAASATPANTADPNPVSGNGQPNAADLEGRITAGSLAGSCAAQNLSFTVGTTKVLTNASTQFKEARCEALKGGSAVEVKGARQGDGSILATSIKGDDEDENENENEDQNEAEVKGAIAAGSIAGSCAASSLSFRVGSTLVKTNSSTQFKDAACASLKAGDSVEVKGARQTDNSVLASRVERKN